MEAIEIEEPELAQEIFSSILKADTLNWKENGYYCWVGGDCPAVDKVLYISVIQSQLSELIKIVVPFLIEQQLSFKMVSNERVAKWILAGISGYDNIGKLITVYIPRNKEAITEQLIKLTGRFKGPAVPDHVHLGGTCYCQDILNCQPAVAKGNANRRLIFQNKYAVLSVLKADAKGDVYKGIYFKGVLNPGLCIIKEGKQFMVSDQTGKDMKDRLQWQKKIHEDLSGVINVSNIIDLFEENGNSYLVMEFIKGKTLECRINEIYKGKIWIELIKSERDELLDLLWDVLEMVEKTHLKGYVHRDLTHVNFLISRKNRCYLIDWELAYGMKLSYPLPAFKLGTEGFMSPEQLLGKCPTEKEDIYGLGALMVAFFTNMPPAKFQSMECAQLRQILYFFTRDRRIGEAIGKCIRSNPVERPTLDQLKRLISALKALPVFDPEFLSLKQPVLPARSKVNRLLRFAFEGLTIPEFTENNGLFKAKGIFDLRTGKRENNVYASGLNSPVNVILYLLQPSICLPCLPATKEFFGQYLNQNKDLFLNPPVSLTPGLFFGSAGKALGIYSFSWSDMTILTGYRNLVVSCFEQTATTYDLAEGIAGQALAAILICKYGHTDFLVERLKNFVEILMGSQLPDGGWPAEGGGKMPDGLDYGVSGILLVLIKYDDLFPAPETKKAIEKALHWVVKNRQVKNLSFLRKTKFEHQDHSLISGTAGIALTYLYAFEHFKAQKYLQQAEKILYRYSEYPVSFNYSFATGISGLGFVYLKAAKLTNNGEWKRRTTKIYKVLSHTCQTISTDKKTWYTGGLKEHDAGFFTGITGILFFLLKLQKNL